MVPVRTAMLTPSLANTLPKRLVMFRSSSIQLSVRHRVRNLDLTADDFLSGCFDAFKRGCRDQILVVVIKCVADSRILEAVFMYAADRPMLHPVFDDLIYGIVHTLDHARQDESRLHPVLVRIHADRKTFCMPLRVFPVLFNRVERPKSGI